MAKISVLVNGAQVLDGAEYERVREAIAGILTTKNVDSKTVKNALQFVGGESFAVSIEQNGTPSDLIEVHEDGKPAAKYLRGNTVARIRVALTVDSWSGEIYTEKSEKTPTTAQKIAAF